MTCPRFPGSILDADKEVFSLDARHPDIGGCRNERRRVIMYAEAVPSMRGIEETESAAEAAAYNREHALSRGPSQTVRALSRPRCRERKKILVKITANFPRETAGDDSRICAGRCRASRSWLLKNRRAGDLIFDWGAAPSRIKPSRQKRYREIGKP